MESQSSSDGEELFSMDVSNTRLGGYSQVTVRGMVPPPPCISYALVQATGVGTVIILYAI